MATSQDQISNWLTDARQLIGTDLYEIVRRAEALRERYEALGLKAALADGKVFVGENEGLKSADIDAALAVGDALTAAMTPTRRATMLKIRR